MFLPGVINAGLWLALLGCACTGSGKVIHTEDTKERYVVLRQGRPGYVLSTIGEAEQRPDLKHLREVHGNLDFICREINGLGNPRIVVETKNTRYYQVVYQWADRDALKVIAKALDLVVTQEEREITAITIRVSPGGHRLKAAAEGKQVKVECVCCDVEGQWPLDGVTTDELAMFLESRYRDPVVNLTSLRGRWSILLSERAGKMGPAAEETVQLDNLGLELRREKVKVLVIVVKDQPKSDVR